MPDPTYRTETPVQKHTFWMESWHRTTAVNVAKALDGTGTWEAAGMSAMHADKHERKLAAALIATEDECRVMAAMEGGR